MRKVIFIILFPFLFTGTVKAKLSVSTSLFILSTIVKYIGAGRVEVSYVIPPSSNPHLFSPTPKSLVKFKSADLFIGVGCGLEFWFDRVSYLRRGRLNLFLCRFYKNPIGSIKLGEKLYANPHIWFDLTFMRDIAIPEIVKEMCKIDKSSCDFYRAREQEYIVKLSKIIDKYRAFFKNHKNLCFVDVKPAFEYLFKSVGKGSCGVVEKDENSMPRLGDLRCLLESCKCRSGLVVYVGNSRTAESIAHLLGYKPVFLNPLGSIKDERVNSYLKLLVFDLNQLKKAVK